MLDTVQRSSLVDQYARKHSYLRISLTDRCNLRCTYCMPEHGMVFAPPPQLLSNNEVLRLAGIFAALGIRKIRLTGGEPLLRQNLLPLVTQIAALPGIETVAMTTNGLLLAGQAAALRAAGLTTLTVSLDTLRRDRFQAIAKRDRLADALRGIDAALAAGFQPVKTNTVIMRGVNDDELLDFVAWARDRPIELRFIEYMPFPDNNWSRGGVMSYREMLGRIMARHDLTPLTQDISAVGKSYRLTGTPATVSFVSSMTESFCGSCNRLRLTADGQIKSCLFHPAEDNLRDALRDGASDAALADIIRAAVWQKPAEHPPMEQLLAVENRSMIAIGG